ncbi:MAG TPA: ATP-binding protein [Burkholderiaceae bacterium]|nr:ATP-binding protein [Burkholderiaceae bacterium]
MHLAPRPHARYRSLLIAALATALLIVMGLALWSSMPTTVEAPPKAGAAPEASGFVGALLFAGSLLLIAAVALLGVWAGRAIERSRHGEALRDARVQAQLLTQLLDVWHWQTDTEHRLTRLQPPRGAPASAWGQRSAAQFLWERFSGGELRERLQAQAPLEDVRVLRSESGEQATRWSLRGTPRFDAEGRFAGYVGTARALDDEDAQRVDGQGLTLLMALLPGPVWLLQRDASDAKQLRVTRGNAAAARLAGVDEPALLTGLRWEQLLAALPEDLRRCVCELQPGRSAPQGAWSVHLQPIAHDAADGEAGTEGLLLAVLRESVGEPAAPAPPSDHESFSYTVSHDLRAPIRVVEGFTRILKEDYGRVLDRIGNDHLDRVLGAAARMNNMIDALLALAQLSAQPLAHEPVNLSQLAGFVVEDLRRHSPERRVQVRIQPEMMARGDPTLLRVVLENLLGNAWKYTSKHADAQIAFERGAYDGRQVFTVRDNGAGFDMRNAARLFGVFQRLHSATDFQGTGIGLASVRRIVRRHGGEIWAESEVGQGASFHFTLPAGSLD